MEFDGNDIWSVVDGQLYEHWDQFDWPRVFVEIDVPDLPTFAKTKVIRENRVNVPENAQSLGSKLIQMIAFGLERIAQDKEKA